MWLWDTIKSAAKAVVEKAKEVIEATEELATTVVDAVDNFVDTTGTLVQAGLNGIRGWVNDNWGNTPLGHIGRAIIDVLKVTAGAIELALNVVSAIIVTGIHVVSDVLTFQWGDIAGRFDDFGKRVENEWKEFIEDISTYSISSSNIGRDVEAYPKMHACSWSVAASLSLNRAGSYDPRTYSSTGKRYEFKLLNGVVWYRETSMIYSEPEWQQIREAGKTDGRMISYDYKRLGESHNVPLFESITASADRVFAKEKGKDNFYFLIMDELFWGPSALTENQDLDLTRNILMPSNYIKLDPEKNITTSVRNHLLDALSGPLPIIPQSERHEVFREILKMGLLEMMVKVKEKVWFLIDARPPLNSGKIPFTLYDRENIPSYHHVTYQSQTLLIGKLQTHTEKSVDYDFVLDLGVGNTHFHEQWNLKYGAELRNTRLEYFQNLNIGEINYSILNGPLSDSDHFADGTCNFYILVRLRSDKKRYVVLYCDEQTLFTQRWRIVDPRDNQPVEIERANFSIAAALDNTRDKKMYGFKLENFWSPYESDFLSHTSRMAVSRGVVLVTGRDPVTKHDEVYSINFGYGICDRTWRWRSLSEFGFNVQFVSEEEAKNGTYHSIKKTDTPFVIFPQTIALREDMQITMKGTSHTKENVVKGYWSQMYLPSNCEHIPSKEEHQQDHIGSQSAIKPKRGYSHPWKFWSENVFRIAERYSHLGVYEKIDDRIQYYTLDVFDHSLNVNMEYEYYFRDRPKTDNEEERDVEMGQLYIKARKINWKKGGNYLKKLQTSFLISFTEVIIQVARDAKELLFVWEKIPATQRELENQYRASRRSMYNADGLFILKHRGPLGWIAVWKDKRDDDLISLSDLPMQVTLMRKDNNTPITVNFKKNIRYYLPPVVQTAIIILKKSANLNSLIIRFSSDRNLHELDNNIWSFHLGAIDERSISKIITIKKGIFYQCFKNVPGSAHEWEAHFSITSTEANNFTVYFDKQASLNYGTSLWFTNVIGQVACPENLTFEVDDN